MNDRFVSPSKKKKATSAGGSFNQQANAEALGKSVKVVAQAINSHIEELNRVDINQFLGELTKELDIDLSGFSGLVNVNTSGTFYLTSPLYGETELRPMELRTYKYDEIESKTVVNTRSNARIQELLNSLSLQDILSTLQESGQSLPAIGVEIDDGNGGKVVEIIDGSRRRRSCILAEKDYYVFVLKGDVTAVQRKFLRETFKATKEHTFLEECIAIAADLHEFKSENPKASIEEFSNIDSKYSASKVKRMVSFTKIPLSIIKHFADVTLRYNFFDKSLYPLYTKFSALNMLDILDANLKNEVRAFEDCFDDDNDLSEVNFNVIPDPSAKSVIGKLEGLAEQLSEISEDMFLYVPREAITENFVSHYAYPLYMKANELGILDEIVVELKNHRETIEATEDAPETVSEHIPLDRLENAFKAILDGLSSYQDDNKGKSGIDGMVAHPENVTPSPKKTRTVYHWGSLKSKKYIRSTQKESGELMISFKGASDEIKEKTLEYLNNLMQEED
ncbi:hypothetical protein BS028_06920 [Vibrio parahaemolyticus]|nr:hypothetical protein [Vibrio parahaemolyticus]